MKVCFLLFMLLLPNWLSGQWLARIKSCERPDHNTLLFFQVPEERKQDVRVEVGFKLEGQKAWKRQDFFSIKAEDTGSFLRKYQLNPGKYLVDVRFFTPQPYHLSFPYQVMSPRVDLRLSDVILSLETFEEPEESQLLPERIEAGTQQLFFGFELYSQTYSQLTARAVLYRDRESGTDASAIILTSVHQINRVMNLKGGKDVFHGQFSLEGLEGGEYLVEILVFEDDRLLAEQSESFLLDWQGRKRIMDDPAKGLQMMGILLSQRRQKELASLSRKEDQQNALLAWWEEKFADESEYEMERFFKKAFEAEAKFTQEGPLWQNDRARAHVLYGEAQRRLVKEAGDLLEHWFYPQWNLNIWFRKNEQTNRWERLD